MHCGLKPGGILQSKKGVYDSVPGQPSFHDQALGIEQINIAVSEMDGVIQRNAANANEAASASEEPASQTQQIKEYVNSLARVVGGSAVEKDGER